MNKEYKLECLYPNNNASDFNDNESPLFFHFALFDKQIAIKHNSFGFSVCTINFSPSFFFGKQKYKTWQQVSEYFSDIYECIYYYKIAVCECLGLKVSYGYDIFNHYSDITIENEVIRYGL